MAAFKDIIKVFSFSILFITLYTVLPYPSEFDFFKYLRFTVPIWTIMVVIFFAYFQLAKNLLNIYQLRFVKYYLFWNIIMFIVGLFVANGYWEYKTLISSSFATFLSIVTYVLLNPYYTQKILATYFRNIIWISIPFFILVNPNTYGFFLFPFSFLLLLFPFLDTKWRIITILVSILALVSDLDARSTVLKFAVAGVLALSYYFGLFIRKNILNLIHKLFMFAPFFLVLTAVVGIFNPFNMDSYIESDIKSEYVDESGRKYETDLKADTRTGLYKEVLETAEYYNSWITGRTAAKGARTELFSSLKDITGIAERSSNEVAILNIFMWTGIIGVVLYFLIFYRAAWLAINKSNSYFMKILGIYLSFRWVYSWVEDINNYSLNYFLIWVMLAMAYSDKFRMMNERELLIWTRGLFYKRYQMGNLNKMEELNEKNENSRTHNLS